ncbi:DUF6476 family protein [Pseudothioclava arenosa]|uniref:Uncharacterized protein n=1 Tax=Pseudothioclava arenosa TaxID=1795308 RepID=A0A2A4CM12_9RHOB|nr:DUF6476 family protein [Pseudothioclava arenosa]PCD77033.1 hypothetical protein CLN94_04445 [Pseudothioclava arenosa]
MSDMLPSDPAPLPEIRFLKILVSLLTATMIAGLVAIVTLLVIRLPGQAPMPELPPTISLPEGASVEAITFAREFTLVVTEAGVVLVYRPDGTLAQELALE